MRRGRVEKPTNLFKTTIVIWAEYDGTFEALSNLAHDAIQGEGYCSKQESVLIEDPTTDPDWDGTEFFGVDDEDDDGN